MRVAPAPVLDPLDAGVGVGDVGVAPADVAQVVAVRAFLDRRILFPEIADVVEEAMNRVGSSPIGDMDDVMAADGAARAVADEVATRLAEARMGTTS